MRVLKPEMTSAGIGVSSVQRNGNDLAGLEHLLRPQHRRGLDAVAGKNSGCGELRPVVHDQRDIGATTWLDSRGDAGGGEPFGCGHAHGATSKASTAAKRGAERRSSGNVTARPPKRAPQRSEE